MEKRSKTLRQAARAAVYFSFKKRHQNRRRGLIAIQSLLIAIVIGLSALLQVYFEIKPPTYALSPEMKSLVGDSRDDTIEYLKEDTGRNSFNFEVPSQDDGEAKIKTGRNDSAYSAQLPKNATEGVSFTDTTHNIAVSLKPRFKTYPGQKVAGDHIVYMGQGGIKLVYTLKYNGLKEDIILPQYIGEEVSYEFDMSLPNGVEAKLDAQGNIGIYSSDPSLFGDISFGSDEDRNRVDKARENGEKTNLIATVPFPIIKDASGNQYKENIQFELGKKDTLQQEESRPDLPKEIPRSIVTKNTYRLTLRASNLSDLSYPISLDPTFQVGSANDFSGVQVGDGTDIDVTDNVIKRMPLTGGRLNTWTTDSDSALPQSGPSVRLYAYNGFMYYFRSGSNIQKASILSGGELGTWVDIGVQTQSSRHAFYNQYVYGTWSNAWRVAEINDSGSISAFAATTMHAAQGGEFEVNAYNGYLYVSGGGSTTGCPLTCNYTNSAAVQYAQIYADGTLSAWASAGPNFTGARRLHQMPIYNGFMYIIAGWQGENGTEQNVVNVAKIQANGTISGWSTTTPTTSIGAQTGAVVIAMSGYLYKVAGYDANTQAAYAQINADGTLGTWQLTTTINTGGRGGSGWATYNGRLYIAGGAGNNGTNQYGDVQYTSPLPVGSIKKTNTYNASNAYTQKGRIVANGYLYEIGGTNLGLYYRTVNYAPINESGTIGSWSPTTSINTARAGPTLYAYGGYLYVISGATGTGASTLTVEYGLINSTGTITSWANTTSLTDSVTFSYKASDYNGVLYVTDKEKLEVYKSSFNPDGTLSAWTSAGNKNGNSAYSVFDIYAGYAYSFYATSLYSNEVYFAPIQSDGTIGSWAQTTSRPGTYAGSSIEFWNGYAYAIGGIAGVSNYSTEIYVAKVAQDGTIGAWSLSSETLGTGSNQFEALIYNGVLLAAFYDDAETNDIYVINNGGSGVLTTWSGAGNTLPGARQKHSIIAHDGYLYMMGGCTQKPCGGSLGAQFTTNAVRSAPINVDGKVGSWTNRNSLNQTRAGASYVQLNGYIYAIGGCTSYSNNSDACISQSLTVEYAQITSGGVLSSWTHDTTNVIHGSNPGIDGQAVAYKNSIYIIPGHVVSTVKKTIVNISNGSISAWTNVTALPSARGASPMIAVQDNLYVFGGCTNYTDCNAVGNTTDQVLVATINSDGTLGSWVQKASLPKKSMFFGRAHVENGYVYLPGGFGNGVTGTNTVIGALLKGGIENIRYATATFAYRADEATTLYNGRLYTTGGSNSSSTLVNDMIDAPLLSIPRNGTFNRSYKFETAVKPKSLIIRGTKQAGAQISISQLSNIDCNSAAYSNPQSIINADFSGVNKQTITIGADRTLARCILLKYTVDDSNSSVFPDDDSETTISGMDLYFTANPGQRLRGGRTFTNGTDRGLDAQPQ